MHRIFAEGKPKNASAEQIASDLPFAFVYIKNEFNITGRIFFIEKTQRVLLA